MCTTMIIKNSKNVLQANNQDIFLENGMFFTNSRGVVKRAFILPPETPLEWVSKYGSISFSQCGKEFPSGGMNEAGLAISQMTLLETVYPATDGRPAVRELQFIQYLLDTCSTVKEALEAAEGVRISQYTCGIHFLLCDKLGDSAVIEFLEGKTVIYKKNELKVGALANSSYKDSLSFIGLDENSMKQINDPYRENSLKRFSKAAECLEGVPQDTEDLVGYAFEALESVSRDDTILSVVYDVLKGLVYFHTKSSKKVKHFAIQGFDFSEGNSSKVLRASVSSGDDAECLFEDYSRDINRELGYSFFRNEILMNIMGIHVPDEAIEYFAAYPEDMK